MGLDANLKFIKPILQKFELGYPVKELKPFVNSEQGISDITQFSQKMFQAIKGKAVSLKPIQTEDEFQTVLQEVMQDVSYKWKNVPNAFDYERAILPYAGRADISSEINTFLREGVVKNRAYTNLTNEGVKKYIQLLEYGLRQLDSEYGNYSGMVWRYGPFSSKTANYVSTSDKMFGAFNIAGSTNPCENTYNVIFTNHGHKIKEMQKRLGFKFAENESEILLDPNKSYLELLDSTPRLRELREEFFKEFRKAYPTCSLNEVKLNFWQEI